MNIKLEGITKNYGSHCVLNAFSAEFSDGVYGLLGPNGAGKSTLINILVGLLKANEGRICFDGKDVKKLNERYLGAIGYLPQYPHFYGNYSILELMQYMSLLKKIPKSEMADRIHEILHFVNLDTIQDRRISQLSGGMRQRLGIAQALLNDPKLLILDEPTAGLDPKERIRFRSLMAQLASGRTILLATHIVSDVAFIANEIILLNDGTKVQQDTPEQLIASIQGKVWEITVPENKLPAYLASFQVSNARHTENGCELRIIAEHLPEAVQVTPNLEDVFLYYFGEAADHETDMV